MGYFDFPHTRTYDTDLGWLIHAYGEILKELDGLQADIEQLEKKLKECREQCARDLAEEKRQREAGDLELKKADDAIRADMLLLWRKVSAELAELESRIAECREHCKDEMQNLAGRLEQMLEEFKTEMLVLVHEMNGDIFNPTSAEIEDHNKVTGDIYEFDRPHPLSAIEFDGIGRPCKYYDDKAERLQWHRDSLKVMTAREYDTRAREWLGVYTMDGNTRSEVTGEILEGHYALHELFREIHPGRSAEDFDAMRATVGMLDLLGRDAYTYDIEIL